RPPAPCPARSFSSLVWEKVPLLVLCTASAGLTMLAQGVARPDNWRYSFLTRLGNALLSYARYVGKAFWPSALAREYPYPWGLIWHWETFAALAFLLAVSGLVFVLRRHRYLVVGWLWFLITLIPMIGLIQVGEQSMADRYAYDSFLGLFIMTCWGVADWAGQHHIPATAMAGLGFAALLALTEVTHRQINYWKDPFTLWSHAQQVVKNHWAAEANLGSLLLEQGKEEEAMPHFFRAAVINPNDFVSNLGIALWEICQRLWNGWKKRRNCAMLLLCTGSCTVTEERQRRRAAVADHSLREHPELPPPNWRTSSPPSTSTGFTDFPSGMLWSC